MNAINWFEIPTQDFDRACRFYEQILKAPLKLEACPTGVKMALFAYEEPGVGGCLIEHPEAKPHPDGTRMYLNAHGDLQGILDRVVAAGGHVILPKTLITEEIGYMGMFSDSEGNIIGLHEAPAAAMA